jgi:hypothetical protein
MADRTLRDMTYTEGVPASGRCSQCGRTFTALVDDDADAGQVTRTFYVAFESHDCNEKTSTA